MNCRECRSLLTDYVERRLSAESAARIAAHLSDCPRCRDIELLLRDGPAVPGVDPPDGLLEGVLRRTTGPACRRAEELLGDLVDGTLAGLDLDLLNSHLDHCGGCRALAASMSRIGAELPSLARVEPDGWFVSRVLAATVGHAGEPVPRGVSLWRRLWQRPRFALELAYVAAAVVWLAVAIGGSPRDLRLPEVARTTSAGGLDAARQAGPRVVARVTAVGDVAWQTVESHGADTLRTVRTDLARRIDRSHPARRALARDGAQLKQAVRSLDIDAGYAALSRVPGNLADVLKQLTTEPEGPSSGLDRS